MVTDGYYTVGGSYRHASRYYHFFLGAVCVEQAPESTVHFFFGKLLSKTKTAYSVIYRS